MPELPVCATFLEGDGQGIILGGKIKTKRKQAAGKARPDQIITFGSGLKSPDKNDKDTTTQNNTNNIQTAW